MTAAEAMDRAVAAAVRDGMPVEVAERLRRRCDTWTDFVELDRAFRLCGGELP